MKKLYFLFIAILVTSVSFGQIWTEDFESYVENTGIEGDGAGNIVNIGDYPTGVTKWTLDATNGNIFASSDWAKTVGGVMDFRDTDGAGGVIWESELINISGASAPVTFQLTASNNNGGFETSDFYNVFYSIDSGTFVLIQDWNGLGDATNTILGEKGGADWNSVETITQSGLTGSTLQIRVQARNSAGAEQFFLDDISVFEGAASPSVNVSGDLSGLDYQLGSGPSASAPFTVSGANLTGDIFVTAPTNFLVSTDPMSGFGPTVTLMQSGGSVASTTLYAVLEGSLGLGNYSGDVTIATAGAVDSTLAASGEVSEVTTQCFDLSSTDLFELVTVTTNTDGDTWTESGGTYNMNGFCGGGCAENVDSWLIFGPLNMSGVSNLSLNFDADENFGNTDLLVQFATSYSGCPDSTSWNLLQVVTELDEGAVSVDLSSVMGTTVYIGIQYVDDGADGYSDWDLSNVELVSTGACPTLGMRPTSDCATCDLALQTESYNCLGNMPGDNNDAVTVLIPYTGLETSITSVTTTPPAMIAGDDPTSVADGVIEITGLSEGDSWDLSIIGGDCDGTTLSGTIPSAECDPEVVVINEINADPSNNANGEGDANGDGTANFSDDEFLEFYNTGAVAIVMDNYTIEVNGTLRHTFPMGTTLNPSTFITVFGGGTPTGIPGNVQVASTGSLVLSNSGASVVLKDAMGTEVSSFTYSGAGNNQSIGRSPDFTGGFVDHSTIMGNGGALYSPNLENDDATLSVNQFEGTNFSIYPNPTNTGMVTITSTTNTQISVVVFDILGKQVKNQVLTNNTLDVSDLRTGIYMLQITQNDATTTKKLVVK